MNICTELSGAKLLFKQALFVTEKRGIETGARICKEKDGTLVVGTLCFGNACALYLDDCPKQTTGVGSFHTHRKEEDQAQLGTLFSGIDIQSSMTEEDKIMCLGHHKQVKCVHFPDMTPKQSKELAHEGKRLSTIADNPNLLYKYYLTELRNANKKNRKTRHNLQDKNIRILVLYRFLTLLFHHIQRL